MRSSSSETSGTSIQTTNTTAATIQQVAVVRALVARQRGLVERPGAQVHAHAQPDQREADTRVFEGLSKQDFHHRGSDRKQSEGHRQSKPAIAITVTRIALANASCPSVTSSPVRCGSSEVWIA